ncbi:glycoside hydrolase family 2 TIM barrel-domain containing protein [Demequina soli]|uniref:glycoside hydrolase family 2 TIM barrel-domain containing protein n=1 Tax=Demequina soli TaxID=1638987 RepID=UPI0007816A2B|nr:glycoside hydrolase family 2 TIM barrel-domain containing protein [Demequina soli]
MTRTPFVDGWSHRKKVNPFAEMGKATAQYAPVAVPHDAMLGRERDPDLERGSWAAYFPGGTEEYTATLDLPDDVAGRRVVLEFEGAYRGAVVHVNGDFAGHRPYGYSRFLVDASHLIRAGANEIHVETRNHQDGRWYTGAGLFRPVWLHVLDQVHLGIDGIRITTPDIDGDRAIVEVSAEVENHSASTVTVEVEAAIAGPAGAMLTVGRTRLTLLAGSTAITRHRLSVETPELWSVDRPALHTATVTLHHGDVAEAHETAFGIRRLQLDPERGLRINGETVKLRGACIHHDNGVLGAATFTDAEERRVRILKESGFNAIRAAHNPLSTAFIEACDRLGMLVMDEAFDSWTVGKTDFGYQADFPEWWERDLESMISRDFNHPSVIMYSIGNEIPETGTPMGGVWGRRIAEKTRALDPTRFVTNGINGMLAVMPELQAMMAQQAEAQAATAPSDGAGINTMMTDLGDMMNMIGSSELVTEKTMESFGVLDVAGMNYLESRYESDRAAFPQRIIIGTETFPTRIDQLWALVESNPHVLGDFTWTGWDYLGEVGIGRVRYLDDADEMDAFSGAFPWIAAWCGDVDITGHRRPQSYYREIVFGLRPEPYIAVRRPEHHGKPFEAGPWAWSDSIASWDWPGHDGATTVVEVYSDADEVELLINGRSLGRRAAGRGARFRAEFELAYEPGTVEAIAYRSGELAERFALRSASGEPGLKVTAEPAGSAGELLYVPITVEDGTGVVVTAARSLRVDVAGPGVLQGLGSGAPVTEESYLDDVHTTFDGRALAIVRRTGEGPITLRVSTDGLADTSITLA